MSRLYQGAAPHLELEQLHQPALASVTVRDAAVDGAGRRAGQPAMRAAGRRRRHLPAARPDRTLQVQALPGTQLILQSNMGGQCGGGGSFLISFAC